MKVVIAPDSFKGCLTAFEVAQAIERGIKRVMPAAETLLVPMADGGEGTMESLITATNGRKVEVTVRGPLLDRVQAAYGILGDEETCVIEMACASGLCLVEPGNLNPLITTTYGMGELIQKALNDGYRKFILALGGSATNDAGVGMLQALGINMLDNEGINVGFGGAELSRIVEIDMQDFDSRIAECEFLIATDVQNPLIGADGASKVFSPQKGATPVMVETLEEALSIWADLVEIKTGMRLHSKAGAGAAGGIGGAFQAFFPSQTKRGVDIVNKFTNLTEKLSGAQCVFTGEGQIDYQTASGKTPMGVAEEAKKKRIPVFALAGSIGTGFEVLYKHGITSVHSIVNTPMSIQEALERGAELLENLAEQVMRTYMASLEQ
ncbi:glycerate kinase [Peribacillus sp. NPDC097675]|uniref:glycerate kinase n=1 Tax=Peribacillus sp. NPDC097675 TaxID=3390618 RepID=UPI003CFF3301